MMIFSSMCNTEYDRLGDGNCLSAFAIIRLKTMLVSKFQSFSFLGWTESPDGDSIARDLLVLSSKISFLA